LDANLGIHNEDQSSLRFFPFQSASFSQYTSIYPKLGLVIKHWEEAGERPGGLKKKSWWVTVLCMLKGVG